LQARGCDCRRYSSIHPSAPKLRRARTFSCAVLAPPRLSGLLAARCVSAPAKLGPGDHPGRGGPAGARARRPFADGSRARERRDSRRSGYVARVASTWYPLRMGGRISVRRAFGFRLLLLGAGLYAGACASSSDPQPGTGGSSASSAGSAGAAGGSSAAGSGGLTHNNGGTAGAGAPSTPIAGSSGQAGHGGQTAGCAGSAPPCTTGGVPCSDVFMPAECVNDKWQCPSGSIPPSQCACIGAPLLCSTVKVGGACLADAHFGTCAGGGWSCPPGTVNSGACLCVLSANAEFAGAGGEAGEAGMTCP
jgi:hypothetical protein